VIPGVGQGVVEGHVEAEERVVQQATERVVQRADERVVEDKEIVKAQ
jgi:hypothetical protein